MKIPIDPEENKKERIRILNKARTNPELRALIMKKSQVDNTFWTDLFAWTHNARVVPSNMPFILYPKQEELDNLLDELLERSRKGEEIALFIDKPRDVGVTITLMNWLTRHFLFDEYFNALVGSRVEDYVDKTGNVKTLFYKIDYTMLRLPKWMLRGYSEKQNRSSMSIRNPINNNTIDGESSNPNFGRGDRRSVAVLDELAFWETARSAWESCGETTNFRIAVTTPPEEGKDSFCYKLRNGQEGKVIVFDFNWNDVPGRDEAWLAMKKESRSDAAFNREVMKSYDGTVEGKVYALDLARVKIEKCEYDPRKPLYVTMDDGLDGTALIWLQKDFHTGQLFALDCYQNFGKDISFYAPFFGYPVSSEYEYNDYDLEVIERHKYWGKATFFGDPSIKQTRNNTGESCRDVLQRKFGIWVECKDWNNRKWKDLRDLTKPTFRRLSIDPDMCEKLVYALRNARYPKVKEAANTTQAPQKPIHDCLVGDTNIRTLNGWKKIKDIQIGEYVWGYKNGMLVPAEVSWAGIGREKTEIIEIGLDSGKFIRCTPDHPIMRRNGDYVRADELKPQDSLMPFYEINDGGYVRIDLNNESYAPEHRYIYNFFNGEIPQGYHIDHINGDHFDNRPENLCALESDEHCSKTFRGVGNSIRNLLDRTDYSREFYDRKMLFKCCKVCEKEYYGDYRTVYCSSDCRKKAPAIFNSPEMRRLRNPNHEEIAQKATKNFEKNHKAVCEVCKGECSRRAKRCSKCRYVKNHKVRYVKTLSWVEDTYDITVPDTANFVAEGVIVHNSTSHLRSAYEYFCDNEGDLTPYLDFQEEVKEEFDKFSVF